MNGQVTTAKITDRKIKMLIAMASNGERAIDIGLTLGVSAATVSKWAKREGVKIDRGSSRK
jgi:uncharacterized protein YjcR